MPLKTRLPSSIYLKEHFQSLWFAQILTISQTIKYSLKWYLWFPFIAPDVPKIVVVIEKKDGRVRFRYRYELSIFVIPHAAQVFLYYQFQFVYSKHIIVLLISNVRRRRISVCVCFIFSLYLVRQPNIVFSQLLFITTHLYYWLLIYVRGIIPIHVKMFIVTWSQAIPPFNPSRSIHVVVFFSSSTSVLHLFVIPLSSNLLPYPSFVTMTEILLIPNLVLTIKFMG